MLPHRHLELCYGLFDLGRLERSSLMYVAGEFFRLPEMRKDDDSLYRILLQETASAEV